MQSVKQKWEAFASHYSSVDQTPQHFSLTLFELLNRNIPKQIIDIGCGRACNLPVFYSKLQKNQSYHCFQICQSLLNQAKELNRFIPNVQFTCADKMCFQSGRFDAVLANQVLIHTYDPDLFLQQVFQVLKTGGQFALSVWGDKSKCKYFTLMSQVLQELKLSPTSSSTSHSPFFLSEPQKLRLKLEEHGFKVIKLWKETCPYQLDSLHDVDCYFQSEDKKHMLNNYSEQQRHMIIKLFKQKFMHHIAKGPFFFQAVCCLAQKINPLAPFLKTWKLIPELCKYSKGSPPAQGLYQITAPFSDLRLHFKILWKEGVDEKSVSYQTVADDNYHQLGNGIQLKTKLIGCSLNSQTLKQGKVISSSIRQIVGKQLKVWMKLDEETEITQYYQSLN